MSEKSSMELQEDLDDAKAIILLCGDDAEKRRACSYFYEKYSVHVMDCVRAKYRSLPSDLVVNAVHEAFQAFYDEAATSPEFDQDHPDRFLVVVAKRRACDIYRQRTGRGKFKEELYGDLSDILTGTQTGKAWSLAAGAGYANELQDILLKELENFGERQRKVARLLVTSIEHHLEDTELAELYRQTYHEPVTVPIVKSARAQVRIKFKALIEKHKK